MKSPLRSIGVVLTLIGVLLTSACSDNADDRGDQQGYLGGTGQLTRIPPDQRRPIPVVSGDALGGGGTVSTADYSGRVIVLNVWGSWCPPCRQEAPGLQAASVETKDTAQFIGITVKDYAPAQAEAFVRAYAITYPSIFDPTGAALLPLAGDLPPSAIPSTLIVDREGRLAVRVLAQVSEITLVDMIEEVAAGR